MKPTIPPKPKILLEKFKPKQSDISKDLVVKITPIPLDELDNLDENEFLS